MGESHRNSSHTYTNKVKGKEEEREDTREGEK
jgi:hypothetical protein